MNKHTFLGVMAFCGLLLSPLAHANDSYTAINLNIENLTSYVIEVKPEGASCASSDLPGTAVVQPNGTVTGKITATGLGCHSNWLAADGYFIINFYNHTNGVQIGGYRYSYSVTTGFAPIDNVYADFWPTSSNQSQMTSRVEPFMGSNIKCGDASTFQACNCTLHPCNTGLGVYDFAPPAM
jgi:hypothetical protein